MKTPDYSNLHKKTFLDFTDDPEVIKEVLGGSDLEANKVYFWNIMKSDKSNVVVRMNTFQSFCNKTKNEVLREELERQLGKKFKKNMFNE